MRILLTGGAGFIGSHIVDALVDEGHEVSIVDDLSSGKVDWVNSKASFFQIDIRDSSLEDVVKSVRPEVVCHQAARANVRESMAKPLLYADVNVMGSLNLLECCRKTRVRQFVYASTGGAVYGEPLSVPVSEDHPINPLDPYGASKHFVEHYLYLYRRHFDIEYVALRYPNVFGPRQDPNGEAGVVAIFASQMLEEKQPVINGTGEQERDFVFVSDVVRANVLALGLSGGHIFNIGGGVGTSVNTIFDHLAELTGYRGERVHGPAKGGEVSRIYLDARSAQKTMGWSPEVDLREGLARTVEFLKKKTG